MLTDIVTALLCTLAGCFAGHQMGGWRDKRLGALMFVILMAMLTVVFLAKDHRQIMFMPVLSTFTVGLARWWSIAFAAPCVLFLLARWLGRPSRLPGLVRLMAIIVGLRAGLLTAVAPAFSHAEIIGVQTRLDQDEVCLQSTDYLCGPAAAVTALRKLGIHAEERELSELFGASRLTATQDDRLAHRLAERYQRDGLYTEHGYFTELTALRSVPVSIAVIRLTSRIDHFVTVMEVTENEIVLGDPLVGLRRQSHAEFLKQWRRVAIRMNRDTPRKR